MDDIPVLLPALRGDKYKNYFVLVYLGQEVALWGIVFFVCLFCLTSNTFEGNKLNLKCLSRKKATGLAISTVAQVETAKNKHTEHLKECMYLGVITSYSGTQNTLCFECTSLKYQPKEKWLWTNYRLTF